MITVDKRGDRWDSYFYYAAPSRRGHWYNACRNVIKEDVTCKHCDYVTSFRSFDPKKAFAQHMRKYHRAQWNASRGIVYVISEEPDESSLLPNTDSSLFAA